MMPLKEKQEVSSGGNGSDGSPAQCVVDVSVTHRTADKAGPFSLPWLENTGICCSGGGGK